MTLGGPSDVLRFYYHSIQTCSIVALCEGPNKKWPEMGIDGLNWMDELRCSHVAFKSE